MLHARDVGEALSCVSCRWCDTGGWAQVLVTRASSRTRCADTDMCRIVVIVYIIDRQ